MSRKGYLFILIFFLSGCATTQTELPQFDNTTQNFVVETETEEVKIPDSSPELQNIDEEIVDEYVEQNGVVFAKTQFEGVLKTSYVQLKVQDVNHKDRFYQLHIGEKATQNKFPWEVKTVNPGYFYIELPEGSYRITSITIPVGSTTAMEEINLTFDVLPNTITYLGTMKIVGTKEKIKLGTELPLIQPGFEYTAEILDQTDEAQENFNRRYPNVTNKITPKLMIIN